MDPYLEQEQQQQQVELLDPHQQQQHAEEKEEENIQLFDASLPAQHTYLGLRQSLVNLEETRREALNLTDIAGVDVEGGQESHVREAQFTQHEEDRVHGSANCDSDDDSLNDLDEVHSRSETRKSHKDSLFWHHSDDGLPVPGEEVVACVLLFRNILLMPSETMPIRISSEFASEMIVGLDDQSLVTLGDSIRFPRFVGHLDCGPRPGPDSSLIGRVGTLAQLQSVVSPSPPRIPNGSDTMDQERDWADVTIYGVSRFKLIQLEIPSGQFHAIARIRVLPDENNGNFGQVALGVTSIPSFVHNIYSPIALCSRIVDLGARLLKPFGLSETSEGLLLPTTRFETERFSYWLARNLPLDMRTVRSLLEINSTEKRLLKILEHIEGVEEILYCGFCNAQLATTSNVISMSTDGATGSFMNAHGYTHQLLTINEVEGYFELGETTTEHTYFPGYAWTCIACRRCNFHIGWKYEAVTPRLRPSVFFGLLRSMLKSSLPEPRHS
mmetsp:Transcript_1798/g.4179  ORF Transcript_1798/g.4179 Transcript_1798/m.4179 type:complete len:498 (+) Transcript_1798:343-1836(+)